jgi:Fe-S cluster assembly iron-binding protein IscA
MNITIDKKTEEFIQQSSLRNTEKIPTVCIVKGGCAGSMLVLRLLEKDENNKVILVNDLEIAITDEVAQYTDDISICMRSGLSTEITVLNNSAIKKCRCGKSFSRS